MSLRYRHADNTQEAIKQLCAELYSLARIGQNKFYVHTHSGKSIILIGTSPIPPASVMIGSRNQFTLAYSRQLPNGERPSDHCMEVVHDQIGLMWFREGGEFLTSEQVAVKLVTLVADR